MDNFRLPVLATLAAIAITTTMDFTGYLMFSALPLTGLILVFWLIQRQSRAEIGLTLGRWKDYGLALAYPVLVLGATVVVAWLSGALTTGEADWSRVGFQALMGSSVGTLMVMLTEEGFFRGWLWGAFKRAGSNEKKTLVITTLVFTAWHVSAVTSGTDYGLPWNQIPVYLINVAMLGLIWGLMRLISGSVVVASVSHAVWNAGAYGLFGYGTKSGALGVADTRLFGPEVGYLGLLLNAAFLLWLLSRAKKSGHFSVLPQE